jgi:hypothetical protein
MSEVQGNEQHEQNEQILLKKICRHYMNKRCKKENCEYIHDRQLCRAYWMNIECKFGKDCKKNHYVTNQSAETNKITYKTNDNRDNKTDVIKKDRKRKDKYNRKRVKNTETFEPRKEPVDMRIIYDLGNKDMEYKQLTTTRDVVLVPNLFNDYEEGEIYKKLVEEIENCGIEKEELLKLWHGNNVIPGTHLIANDRTNWKLKCPTFNMVLERLKSFFKMDIQATRFNWYTDTSHWKPFHHDAAYVKADKADIQNFTVAVSFGATRDAAFEHATTKTVISLPQEDGCVYAFAKETNGIWRHGILQDLPIRNEGRISVIAWGAIDNQVKL